MVMHLENKSDYVKMSVDILCETAGLKGENMKKINKILLLLTIVAAGTAIFGSSMVTKAQEEQRVAEGVYIGKTYVGGMTEEEVTAAIESYITEAETSEFTFSAGENHIKVNAAELGIHFSDMNVVQEAMDVGRSGNIIKRYKDKKDLEQGDRVIPMPLKVNHSAIQTLLEEKAEELNQEAVNNGLVREEGEFRIIEGKNGVEVNVSESIAAVESYLSTEWDGLDAEVELVAEVVAPRGTREELEKVQDLLGSYTTNYKDSSANRCENISIAASKIDGTVLYPGEELSVAEAFGPLTGSNGYKLAGAYENGQVVESYGGGVCQVSTTLYNAVILAELEITERFNHSMIVSYVKPSQDAAIAGDYKDLKFVNNQESPIYLEGYTVGKNVYFNIYGEETRPEGREVRYESEVVSQQDPGIQFVATGDPVGYIGVAQGKHTGYVARLWKIVTVDGVEESREAFNKSTYRASPKIVNVGTASADPNISAAIGAAIATGDEATVYAAVAPYAANAAAILNPTPPAPPATAEEQSIVGEVDPSQITNGQ